MTAFGNGRIWTVAWDGRSADTVRRDLIDVGRGAVVRCGNAGALWTVVGWQELSGDRVGATLAPASAHGISPAVGVTELPIPSEAM
jgi:hypothetical protein